MSKAMRFEEDKIVALKHTFVCKDCNKEEVGSAAHSITPQKEKWSQHTDEYMVKFMAVHYCEAEKQG